MLFRSDARLPFRVVVASEGDGRVNGRLLLRVTGVNGRTFDTGVPFAFSILGPVDEGARNLLFVVLLLLGIAAPLGLLLALDPAAYSTLVLALLLGTPVLSLIGSIGAALTVGVRRGGVLLSLLVMPLYIPALIFGVLAVEAAIDGLSARPHLLLLGADLLVAAALTPWAAAAAIRLNLE